MILQVQQTLGYNDKDNLNKEIWYFFLNIEFWKDKNGKLYKFCCISIMHHRYNNVKLIITI